MLDPRVTAQAAAFAEKYNAAKPFRHLCIENFFLPEHAEAMLADFPSFDPAMAVNEHGKIGGKAVVEDIAKISPFYEQLHAYVCGEAFLKTVREMTGIPDLEADPFMYGGGTHDNRDGQELDPHIDFNYDPRNNRHRRMNLLVYLNKEWDPAWGGSIELHANPRKPDEDQILSFAPVFNRAVLFETNEYSWHGFPRIVLPKNKSGFSRKCISLYFYSPTRPAEEIAPPHGTHYIPRPLPREILRKGRVLNDDDIGWIDRVRRERDHWIAFYQKKEIVKSAETEDIRTAMQHYKDECAKLEAAAAARLGEAEHFRKSMDHFRGEADRLEAAAHARAEEAEEARKILLHYKSEAERLEEVGRQLAAGNDELQRVAAHFKGETERLEEAAKQLVSGNDELQRTLAHYKGEAERLQAELDRLQGPAEPAEGSEARAS